MKFPLSSSRRVIAAALTGSFLFAVDAHSHVKWFCGPIDDTLPPLPLHQVMSTLFVAGVICFTALVSGGGGIDALFARIFPGAAARIGKTAFEADVILRLAMALYAFCLWQSLAVIPWADGPSGSILTPELLTQDRLLGFLQAGLAVVILIPQLSIVAALGITFLYGVGAARYGLFHMVDYLFFLGLAAYFALSDPALKRKTALVAWRVPFLTTSISVSLMWTAVEKFLYPQWTIAVLQAHPNLTAGFPSATVATIAGFVEFSLAFYLLVSRQLLGRLNIIVLGGVFLLAMPEFGMIDVVGHIPIIAIFAVMFLRGETRLQRVLSGAETGVISSSFRIGACYLATLAVLMVLYDTLHGALL